MIRPARVYDVSRMMKLINGFAREGFMLFRGPQVLYEDIRDFIVLVNESDVVFGCGALHVLWEDVAEVRAVAIDTRFHGQYYGTQLVRALIEQARSLGVSCVYAFTVVPAFFRKLDFTVVQREEIPHKLYTECSRCPKFYACDEVAMVNTITVLRKKATEILRPVVTARTRSKERRS